MDFYTFERCIYRTRENIKSEKGEKIKKIMTAKNSKGICKSKKIGSKMKKNDFFTIFLTKTSFFSKKREKK
ncbi:hypothetical protein SDC9_179040 [bioreactor metagenome]|uniref:Uncharacterized protein n=1 Tax=bioreactor metagenome TaxID=1076179 RepID=A0A645GZA0_9ZZZZ